MSTMQTGHVGINVTDIERSIAFYTKALGLSISAEGKEDGRRFALLTRDGQLLVALWQQSTEGFATDRAGLHHMSFQVESVEDVKSAEQVLRELGTEFAYDGIVPHGEGASSGGIFFTDPDGTRLEIYAPEGAEGTAPVAGAPTCGFF
ncbi:VOC family protein [Streptomyces sp. N2-109]|uniref:VOC family protein n=1 Tax=Streptomyces gossypii TaxID=2883101 RepID=A0ABT2JZ16_9ACTN|nr:VOC family protein [Streptomyces gossypii]MCT2593147.1 VOC family protein [Streptomyces gossypii]